MKKNNRSLLILFVVMLSLGLLMVTRSTEAGANAVPKYGFLGGTTAWAMLEAFPTPGFPANCRITSYTSPSTSINVIGWTWWQCDLLKNGIVFQSVQGGSRAINGSSTSATITFAYIPSGVNGYRAVGVHDFNHIGSNPSPWRPYHLANN